MPIGFTGNGNDLQILSALQEQEDLLIKTMIVADNFMKTYNPKTSEKDMKKCVVIEEGVFKTMCLMSLSYMMHMKEIFHNIPTNKGEPHEG